MPGIQQDNQINECSNCPPRQQGESFSVDFLLQVINGASDPIFVKDRQHCWVLVNHAFCNLMGHSEEELIGKSDFDFFAKTEADVFWEKDEFVFTTGLTDENEEFFTDVNGDTNFILTKKSFIEDEGGNQFLVGTIRDITKRKLVEEALLESEVKYQKLSANVPGVLYRFRLQPDGLMSCLYISSGCFQIFEIEKEVIQADVNALFACVHPDERQKFEHSLAVSAQTLKPWQWEGKFVLSSQQVKWLQCTSRPERQKDGSIIWDGLIVDVTRRKQAEEALSVACVDMEKRVLERTQELAKINKILQAEINDRQLALSELRGSQQRLTRLIKQIPLAVIEWNINLEVQSWNPAAEKIFGHSKTEALGRHIEFLVPESAREHLNHLTLALLIQEGGRNSINDNLTAFGETIVCEWHNSPLIADNGEVIGVASIAVDITERKMGQKNLMLYKQALDSSSDAIGIADATGIHIYHNPAFSKLYECQTPEEFGHRGSLGAVITNPLVAQEIWQTTVSFEAWIGEVEQRSFGGRIIQTFLRSYPIKDSTGNNIGFVGAITDITERKLKEVQLQEQEQLLRSIFDGTENPIFVYDVVESSDLRIVGWNAAAERGSGLLRAQVMDKTPEEVYNTLSRQGGLEHQRFIKCIETGQSTTYEECIIFHDEEIWWFTVLNPLKDSSGKIYRLVGTTSNITERKRAEIKLQQQTEDLQITIQELQRTQMQLVQSEKMSSLGQLVAGVAHEINNPVNFIYANLNHANKYIEDLLNLVQYQRKYPNAPGEVEALAVDIDLDFLIDDLPKLLRSMKVGANRIKEIVASLRTFSRMDEAEMKEVDIHEGIDSTLMILEHRFKAKSIFEAGTEYLSPAIEVIKEYGELPLVECYAGQLNQVFMNILANAIDALEQSFVNGITTSNPEIHIRTGIVAENQVIIYIVDNGPGVPEKIKQRLFDPFFTTKPVGKGTGMGLSISYQIITQRHGGSLECVSSPGGGSTSFAITIPLRQGKSGVRS
jgi:PAS domain S-box-containing protein